MRCEAKGMYLCPRKHKDYGIVALIIFDRQPLRCKSHEIQKASMVTQCSARSAQGLLDPRLFLNTQLLKTDWLDIGLLPVHAQMPNS